MSLQLKRKFELQNNLAEHLIGITGENEKVLHLGIQNKKIIGENIDWFNGNGKKL